MTENVQWHGSLVTREQRWGAVSSEGIIVWLTGLSGSGKSTIAMEAELQCIVAGRPAVVLDGDNLRHGLNSDLGFGEADRNENIRRVGEVAILMAEVGMVVLVPLVSPYRAARDAVRERCEGASLRFVEIFVDTPLTRQNQFKMPALITPEQAAEEILHGWAQGRFEIHFPKRFTLWMKTLQLLPHRMYFAIIRRFTGL